MHPTDLPLRGDPANRIENLQHSPEIEPFANDDTSLSFEDEGSPCWSGLGRLRSGIVVDAAIAIDVNAPSHNVQIGFLRFGMMQKNGDRRSWR